MILRHKTNPGFMFHTSKGLRKFNKGKLYLEEELIETIKKTEDFKNGLIEMEEIIKPINKETEVKKTIIKEVEEVETEIKEVKPKKRKNNS